MAITQQHDFMRIQTPQGHEIVAHIKAGQVVDPKVVNKYTGVMVPLAEQAGIALANALQASEIGQRTQLEADSIQKTLDGFGKLAKALGNNNPAISPYLKELEITQTTAKQMLMQAKMFESQAVRVADEAVMAIKTNVVDACHGLKANYPSCDGSRTL